MEHERYWWRYYEAIFLLYAICISRAIHVLKVKNIQRVVESMLFEQKSKKVEVKTPQPKQNLIGQNIHLMWDNSNNTY